MRQIKRDELLVQNSCQAHSHTIAPSLQSCSSLLVLVLSSVCARFSCVWRRGFQVSEFPCLPTQISRTRHPIRSFPRLPLYVLISVRHHVIACRNHNPNRLMCSHSLSVFSLSPLVAVVPLHSLPLLPCLPRSFSLFRGTSLHMSCCCIFYLSPICVSTFPLQFCC